MPKKKPTTADAAKRLALLWGSQTNPGRSGLHLKAIVQAAIEIADKEGLSTLSMRNVAERLEVGAMSLYTHVPGKTELVELMVDTTYSELYDSIETPSQQPGDWREALKYIARQNWNLFRKHPWLLEISQGRPTLGPHAMFKYEAELRPLDELELSDVEMDATLSLILSHVEGCARSQRALEQVQQETNETDAEWWVTQGPLLDKMIQPTQFPTATRVGTRSSEVYQAASSPEFVLTFGLERILDGIVSLLESKQRS